MSLRLRQEIQALPRPPELTRPTIHVAAGVLEDTRGRVLIARRPAGKHMAGGWEFPGGKRAEGEPIEDALHRELDEELGVRVEACRPLIRYPHDYPDRRILLDVWRVTRYAGEPVAHEHDALDWCPPGELMERGLLPADRAVATALRMPDTMLITGERGPDDRLFGPRLAAALDRGIGLVQLRATDAGPERLAALAREARAMTKAAGALLVVNGPPGLYDTLTVAGRPDGWHLAARHVPRLTARPVPPDVLLGVSCHDAAELAAAEALGADYALLGPVLPTASHPGAPTLGWDGFRRLVEPVPLPVYAVGGLAITDLESSWSSGGQGVAAISSLWAGEKVSD